MIESFAYKKMIENKANTRYSVGEIYEAVIENIINRI